MAEFKVIETTVKFTVVVPAKVDGVGKEFLAFTDATLNKLQGTFNFCVLDVTLTQEVTHG